MKFNKSVFKPLKQFKFPSPLKTFKLPKMNFKMPILPKYSFKGASIPMQRQWAGFSIPKRIVMRSTYRDTDRDGVPDRWDCQPFNKFKQEDESVESSVEQEEEKQSEEKEFSETTDDELTKQANALLSMNPDEELKKIKVENIENLKKGLEKQKEIESRPNTPLIVNTEKLANAPSSFKEQVGLDPKNPNAPVIYNKKVYERRMFKNPSTLRGGLREEFKAPDNTQNPNAPVIYNKKVYERRMFKNPSTLRGGLREEFRAPNTGYKVVDGKRVGGVYSRSTFIKKHRNQHRWGE